MNSEVDYGIIVLLASVFIETNAYDKALQHIEHSHLVYYSGEELPLNLKNRAGICHIHLGNMENFSESIIVLEILFQSPSTLRGGTAVKLRANQKAQAQLSMGANVAPIDIISVWKEVGRAQLEKDGPRTRYYAKKKAI
ncbi:hypothetical protein QYF36_023803 [Acer negundo]|nr:hypothetical protein QYF36_008960 [Acer negundo]KAK4839665.1 hypothetical protein QYF36_023803 [Acer negundo]